MIDSHWFRQLTVTKLSLSALVAGNSVFIGLVAASIRFIKDRRD